MHKQQESAEPEIKKKEAPQIQGMVYVAILQIETLNLRNPHRPIGNNTCLQKEYIIKYHCSPNEKSVMIFHLTFTFIFISKQHSIYNLMIMKVVT